jgi:hypothetical protein
MTVFKVNGDNGTERSRRHLDLYDSYEDILESHKTTHFLSGKRRGRILLQRVIFLNGPHQI